MLDDSWLENREACETVKHISDLFIHIWESFWKDGLSHSSDLCAVSPWKSLLNDKWSFWAWLFFFFTALNSKLLLKQFLTTGEFEDLCIGSDLFSLLAHEPQVLMVHVIPLYRSRLYCYHPVLILFWVISSWKLLVILAGIHWMLGLESLLAVWKCILTTRLVCFKHLHCLCSC